MSMSTTAATNTTTTTTTNTSLVSSLFSKLSSFSVSDVGCGLNAQMATVIAVGPSNVAAGLRASKSMADIGKVNNNVVTTVIVGVETDADALAALSAPTPRIFLAGAHELKRLADASLKGPMRAYLKEAVLLAIVPGSRRGVDHNGHGGIFLIPSAPIPMHAEAPIVARGNLGLTQWIQNLNAQWQEFFLRLESSNVLLDGDKQLLEAYTTFAPVPGATPVANLANGSVAFVGQLDGPPMHLYDHTIVWREKFPMANSRLAVLAVGARGYATASWCTNTKAAMRNLPVVVNSMRSFTKINADVLRTLSSLIEHRPKPPVATLEGLKGVLGPVVLAGRDGREPMRVSAWRESSDTPWIVILLPNSYITHVLSDYAVLGRESHGTPLLSVASTLVLNASDEMPISFEDDDERARFGPRVWVLRSEPSNVPDGPAPMPPTIFKTQQDAQREVDAVDQRVVVTDDRVVFFTTTISDDAFSGLRVRWTGGATPVLDMDDEAQRVYES